MLTTLAAAAALAVSPPTSWVDGEKTGSLLYTMDTSFMWNWKAMPTVGNGYVSTLVTNQAEYVAGVYNWRAETQSSRATFPASTNISMVGEVAEGFAVDMGKGVVERVTENGIIQRWYAHRVQKNLLVTEFLTTDASLQYKDGPGVRPVRDCTHATDEDPGDCYMKYAKSPSSTPTMDVFNGKIDEIEYPGSPLITFTVVRTPINSPAVVNGVTRFLSSRVTSLESSSTEQDAITMYKQAVHDEDLFNTHTAAWGGMAVSGIFVEGDRDLAQSINSSFYGIRSALHKDVPWDTSPGGLSTNGYWGNVFWDSDLWIYPNALLFNNELSRMQMKYRFDVSNGAMENAAMQGWKGYQYPWQSAETGQEVCYNSVYEYDEIHISGDVAQAMWQMYRVTHDKKILEEMVYPVLYNISVFWASRVVRNPDGSYSINNVMCPDEDADGVNNSAYTNSIANQTFTWTKTAAKILNKPTPVAWDDIMHNIRIPFDDSKQYHPEYDGYNGGMVKQADVVLMGYPLMYPMPYQVYLNDLNFYGNHTRESVAMTWAIFTIGYQSIGSFDEAAVAFNKTVRQQNPSGPFHTWGEYEQNSGCPNFLTAAGGFLQSVWAGFGGVRLIDNALTITKPAPPSGGSTRLTLSELYYLQCLVTIDIYRETFTVKLESCEAAAPSLAVEGKVISPGQTMSFTSEQTVWITEH